MPESDNSRTWTGIGTAMTLAFYLFVICAMFVIFLGGLPTPTWAQELPDPVPLNLGKNFDGLYVAFLGPVSKDRAAAKVDEYALASGKDLVGKEKVFTEFKQAYFDTLGRLAGNDAIVLAFFAFPVQGRSWTYPANKTIRVERYDGGAWEATKIFRIRYQLRGKYLKPEVWEIGLNQAVPLELYPEPIDFAAEDLSKYSGRAFSACDGGKPCDLITFFVVVSQLAEDGEHQWPKGNRDPIMLRLVPKGDAS